MMYDKIFLLYKMMYDKIFLLYKKTYNYNKYFHYTRRRIIKYLLSLYKKTYNDNKYFIIQENVQHK